MFSRSVLVTVILGLSLASVQASAHQPAQEPAAAAGELYDAETFAKLNLVNWPKLSPDGQTILFSTQRQGKTFVVFRGLTESTLQNFALPEKLELGWFRWAGNDRILISVSKTSNVQGEEVRKSYLLAVDTATMKAKFIGQDTQGEEGDDVLYVEPSGEWVLLSIQRTIYDYPSVYRASLETGKMTVVQRPVSTIWEWYADNRGVVRMGVSFDRRSWTLHYRPGDTGEFKKLATIRYDDETREGLIEAIRVIGGSDEGYVLSAKATGRYALHRYNYATQTVGELVYGNPDHDITDFDLNEDGSLSAVYYTDDRARVHWFDPAQQEIQASIDKALGTRHGSLVSRSRDGRVKIYHVGASHDPGSFYLFDESRGVMELIARANETIKSNRLSPSQYVSYKARDGLTIHANLTLPRGRDPKGLPLVILPHGGPYGIRDSLSYDVEVQFLASRGYAVLQPNFRGSGGYGEAHSAAGEGAIGRQMQDDLDDGMDWLVNNGTVDANRVCVVGASYGGYAALWAVTRNPERYRCAASFAGVTDWNRILKYDARFFNKSGLRKWRNTIRGDEGFNLDTVSPVAQSSRLTRPVLIAQGEEDTIVPPKQAKIYVEALKAAGKPHEYVSYETEGHGFDDPNNLADWLKRLEAFLARHNPA
ncbi:S9 family peptidase [Blastomonas sp. AAP53]|uniref:alpha/beta hydrolase family protein n=1 Tax=Blastomonas sp. AAP53 TaxID=1248760 RepID=UPI001266EB3B|nr:S9 family peptidase [Blastomonas sp. AAP53]